MPPHAASDRLNNTKVELVMLLLASVATVLVLTIAVSRGYETQFEFALPSALLLMLLASAGVLAATYVALTTISASRRSAARKDAEIQDLERRLTAAEALIRAEPQVLIYWEQGKGLKIVAQTLEGVPGLPGPGLPGPGLLGPGLLGKDQDLLKFGAWLEHKSAAELKTALVDFIAYFNRVLAKPFRWTYSARPLTT